MNLCIQLPDLRSSLNEKYLASKDDQMLSPQEKKQVNSNLDRWKEVRERLIKKLSRQGYSAGTIRFHKRVLNLFLNTTVEHHDWITLPQEVLVNSFVEPAISKLPKVNHTYGATVINKYLTELKNARLLIPKEITKEKDFVENERDRLLQEFTTYMRDLRGVSESSLKGYRSVLRKFLIFTFGLEALDLANISRSDVIDYIIAASRRAPGNRSITTQMRRVCNFLQWAGYIDNNLAETIPKKKSRRRQNIPRYLEIEKIDHLLKFIKGRKNLGIRNYAMCLIMARLGLRAEEVLRIRLKDIDWRQGLLTVRGKGGYEDDMPIPHDVRDAIIEYIKDDRKGNSKSLFVSSRPPYYELKNTEVVNTYLKEACKETKIALPQTHIGSHIFRHSAATDLLRKGAPIEEIANFLRHRSRASTQIYASNDVETLRGIAPEWPA